MVTSNIEVGGVTSDVVTFPVSADLYFLIGDSEVGKSRTLAALSRALGGEDKVTLRRGEISGYVRNLGRDLSITNAVRQGKGDLWFYSIQGLDPSRIIDTGHVDPVRADRERVGLWLELAMVPMDLAPFMDLVGGKDVFEKLASVETRACTSMTDTAERFKADLEDAARQTGAEEEREVVRAAGLRQAIGNIDLEAPSDGSTLDSDYLAAVRELAELEGRAKQAAETTEKLGDAAKTLDQLRAQPAIDEAAARAEIETARAAEAEAREALGSATQAVTAAEQARAEAIRTADAAIAAARARVGDAAMASSRAGTEARKAEAKLEELHKRRQAIAEAETRLSQLGGSVAPAPAAEVVEAAKAKVDAASQAKNLGVTIRAALVQRAEADAAAQRAEGWKQRTKKLREWAAGTWEVLARVLADYLPAGMTIENGRLIQTQGEQRFYFDELSDGTKARIVLTAAARTAHAAADAEAKDSGKPRRRPMLIFKQVFGESLPPNKRKVFRDLCRELDVCVYTAQCADGPLRVAIVDDAGQLQELAA